MPKSFKGRVVRSQDGHDGWHSRGYFPHFDGNALTQHVSFHLFDSLPQSVLNRWREELRTRPQKEADLEWRMRIQDFLDSGYGSCFLEDHRLAEIVESALLHFDGQRYSLHSWCVMPNHVHTLFTPAPIVQNEPHCAFLEKFLCTRMQQTDRTEWPLLGSRAV